MQPCSELPNAASTCPTLGIFQCCINEPLLFLGCFLMQARSQYAANASRKDLLNLGCDTSGLGLFWLVSPCVLRASGSQVGDKWQNC
jgi:hypothetical protein